MSELTSQLWSRLVEIPYEKVEGIIVDFIRGFVAGAGVEGVTLGVSGGVDSTTTLALTVRALGSKRVHAVLMPDPTSTPKSDLEDALEIVESYKVKHYMLDIGGVVEAFEDKFKEYFEGEDRVALGNLKARIRMCMLYYIANRNRLLVVGSGDKSELLIGYFTKYGDGGVDLLPIGGLYKSQVRELAVHLGLPDKIAYKPSSPRLWPGHTAEGELGLEYKVIDQVLYGVFELKLGREEVAREVGVEVEVVDSILERVKKGSHKRRTPPICLIDFKAL